MVSEITSRTQKEIHGGWGMTQELREAIDALDRIFDNCEEIDLHLLEEQRSGYKMIADINLLSNYLRLCVHDLTKRDTPMARYQCRCGVCDLDLNECDWGDEDWCLSDNLRENYKYCPRCGQRIDWEHDDFYDERSENGK